MMRLRHPSGRVVHLSYEVPARPARRLPALLARLDTYATVRTMIGADTLGVSLWLPPALAAALAVGGRGRTRLRAELDARRLEVVTLSGLSFDEENGSPFAEGGGESTAGDSRAGEDGEHQDQPGWDQTDRREYTLDVARVLVDLLDEDTVRGAVGTIGLGRRDQWTETGAKAAAGVLRRLSAGLADLAWQNGRAIRVGFQPAPGFALDSAEETVAALSRIDKDRLGVRLDLDHVLATWPDPVAGVEAITDAGLPLIEVRVTTSPGDKLESWRAALAHLFGASVPQTEFLTLAPHVPDPSADEVAADFAYLLAELSALGLSPETELCAAH